MTIALVTPTHDWYCPNCGRRDQTAELRPHSRFHTCPRLGMISAPMLPVGTKAKVERIERQDYTNGDKVQTDENGRPVMAVQTTRDEGTDVMVFAPVARGGGYAA